MNRIIINLEANLNFIIELILMIINQRNNNIFSQISKYKWPRIAINFLTFGIYPLKLILARKDALSIG